MKTFLVIGDLHIKVSNLSTIWKVKDEVLRVIKERNPDFVVIMGDMHDTFERMHMQAWNEILRFIDVVSEHCLVYYVVGNHDMINNQVFITDDHFFNAFKKWDNVVVVDSPEFIPMGDGLGCVGFLPYTPPGRFMEACHLLAPMTKPHGKCRAIFCHQEFKGASFGGTLVSTKGDEWPADGCMIISGHIHEHAWLKPNVLYVGTPYQTNFGESPDKSISLITIDNQKIEEERIYLAIPKKMLITTTPKEFENIPFNDFDNFKVFVTGTTEEIAALKKTKKYKEIDKRAQVILKPTDKSMVKKNIDNLGYMELVTKQIEKETETVKVVFKEAIDEAQAK